LRDAGPSKTTYQKSRPLRQGNSHSFVQMFFVGLWAV
jgi:hypothetical protein